MAILKLNIEDPLEGNSFEVQVSDTLTGSEIVKIIAEMRWPEMTESERLLYFHFFLGPLSKKDSNSSINSLEHTTLYDAGVQDVDSLFFQPSIIC